MSAVINFIILNNHFIRFIKVIKHIKYTYIKYITMVFHSTNRQLSIRQTRIEGYNLEIIMIIDHFMKSFCPSANHD